MYREKFPGLGEKLLAVVVFEGYDGVEHVESHSIQSSLDVPLFQVFVRLL